MRDASSGARKAIGRAVIGTRKCYPARGCCTVQNVVDEGGVGDIVPITMIKSMVATGEVVPGGGHGRVYSLDHAVAHIHMVVTAREMYTVGGGGSREARGVRKCRSCTRARDEEEEEVDCEHRDKGPNGPGRVTYRFSITVQVYVQRSIALK